MMEKNYQDFIIPDGVCEKSQIGLILLKEAILEFIEANPHGVTNTKLARYLNLCSDHNGNQKDYLTYSSWNSHERR